MHHQKEILSFVSDILTKREEANKDKIHTDEPGKAFFQGTIKVTVVICLVVGVVGIVIGNYLLEPQGNHSPSFQVGAYFGQFVKDYPWALLLVVALSALISRKLHLKPTLSGMVKKDIVFLGRMTPEQLDNWTLERSGRTFRPPRGVPLRIAYDFTFELSISPKAEVRYSFDRQPQQQTVEINVTHRHVHEYHHRSDAPKPPNRKRFLGLGNRSQGLLEHHPIKRNESSSRRAKLEALANDPKASPDERIAALNKLKEL